MNMRSNPPHRQRDGAVVETPDYYVAQAYNGHIQVYDKTTNGMVMHISCTAMYPKEKLQAFADRLQAANSRSIEDSIAAMQALA